MMQIRHVESPAQVGALKQQYVQTTTAPLDGMWLCGFVPMARHFGFYADEKLVGFCCVNDEGYLLQFFVTSSHEDQASRLLESILEEHGAPTGKISGAFASTAEPEWLSLCLDHFSSFDVHTLMYQLNDTSPVAPDDSAALSTIEADHLEEAVAFAEANIGAPAAWLTSYFGPLIRRRELFGSWDNGRLVATGECRGYDEYQTSYADLGVIVAASERGQGRATRVLKQLVGISKSRGLKPICSTEKTNAAAQKAISRAGFSARNRIVRFDAPGPART